MNNPRTDKPAMATSEPNRFPRRTARTTAAMLSPRSGASMFLSQAGVRRHPDGSARSRASRRKTTATGRRFWFRMAIACTVLWLSAMPVSVAQKTAPPAGGEKPADDPNEAIPEVKLPKFEDMKLPSMKELLEGEPVDWIVLKNDDVVVTAPIYPRPNTLEKMQAKIDAGIKGPRPTTQEERDKLKQRLRNLHMIDVSLPGKRQNPEYQLDMKYVDRIIYHEDLMIQRMDKLLNQGKLASAYEMLFSLTRRQPKWPGLKGINQKVLFLEGQARLRAHRPAAALVYFEELHRLRPGYPGLRDALDTATDALVTRAVQAADYRQARYYLARLRQIEPGRPVLTKWRNELSKRAAIWIGKARSAANAKRADVAASAIERAAEIWLASSRQKTLYRRYTDRFQTLRVGVPRLAGDPATTFVPTRADRRQQQLIESPLFHVSAVDETSQYRSTYLEQWVPTDLGRRAVFKLRPNRSYWESRPILTAGQIVSSLSARIDPANPLYDERLESYIRSISVQSPFEFQVVFSRVPLRTEALFLFPVSLRQQAAGTAPAHQASAGSASAVASRFRIAGRTGESITYRRVIPEPDGAPRFHIAQIIERRFRDPRKAIQSLLRNEISVLPHPSLQTVVRLREDGRFFVRKYALPVTHVLQFNPKSLPLRNAELRRALAYAIDRRKVLADVILQDAASADGRIVTGPFPSSSYAHNPLITPRRYDLALAFSLTMAAKKALKGKFTRLKMIVPPDPVAEQAAEALVKTWARIGIAVTILPPAGAKLRRDSTGWDILYRSVQMTEPVVDLWPFLTFDNRARVASLAYLPDWLRQELIELDAMTNWNVAVEKIHAIHRHLWEQVQMIPLWEIDDFMVVRKNVRGLAIAPIFTYHKIEQAVIRQHYPDDGR